MMAPIPRKRSLADMQSADGTLPGEYNDADYFSEVLRLDEGQTEALFDDNLVQEAEQLGLTISRPQSPSGQHVTHRSMSESAMTVATHHARTASSGSQGSVSTGATSRSSNEQLEGRKRPVSRRSLSFSEYEKYLVQHEAQEALKSGIIPTPMPAEPAPSLFSVSTRRSFVSIRNGIKHRFKLRRNRTSQDDPKYVLSSL